MEWVDLNNKPIKSLPDNCFGFVYMITYTNGQKYIGKKQTIQIVTQPANKTGKKPNGFIEEFNRIVYRDPKTGKVAESKAKIKTLKSKGVKGKVETYYRIRKESNWRAYTGSSELTKGLTIAKKQIIAYSSNKRTLSYLEVYYQIKYGVLHSDKWVNDNVNGCWFKETALSGIIKPN